MIDIMGQEILEMSEKIINTLLLSRQKDNPVENHSLELSFIKSIPTGFYCVFFEVQIDCFTNQIKIPDTEHQNEQISCRNNRVRICPKQPSRQK